MKKTTIQFLMIVAGLIFLVNLMIYYFLPGKQAKIPNGHVIFDVKHGTSQMDYMVFADSTADDGVNRVQIYRHGVRVAFMTKDSLWTIYDCKGTVETLLEVIKKK